MYRLFRLRINNKGIKVSPIFQRAKEKYNLNYNKVLEHYQTFGSTINNNHILMRLINSLQILEGPESLTYRRIDSNKDKIATGLGITTDLNPGELHDNEFYSDTCAIQSVKFMEFFEIKNFKDIRAVRCLTHQNTDLTLSIPEIGKSLKSNGTAVVGIDIPLLAVQYKLWLRMNQNRPLGQRENTGQFITKFILPGMIPEQIDISLRNRIKRLIRVGTIPPTNRKPPIFITEFDSEFDNSIKELIKDLKLGKLIMTKPMLQIPMIFSENYLTAVPTVLSGLSVYSYWIILLVYTDWLYTLMLLAPTIDSTQLRVFRIMRSIMRYIKGINGLKFIDSKIKPEFLFKYNKVINFYSRKKY